jgi:two-component system, NarL family, sensor kinase
MTARLLSLQDEERRRIARELHDQTAQTLFALTMDLDRLRGLLGSEPAEEAERLLAESQALGEQALREIRTLSYVLHPPLLDQAGLACAVRWFADGFATRSGIALDLVEVQDVGRLPTEVETALFRVVQESLVNVQRHSGSATAGIGLTRDPDGVTLRVRDDGAGIPAKSATEASDEFAPVGVGIPGMRQRLRQLGGDLAVASDPRGTLVTARVPVPEVSR